MPGAACLECQSQIDQLLDAAYGAATVAQTLALAESGHYSRAVPLERPTCFTPAPSSKIHMQWKTYTISVFI